MIEILKELMPHTRGGRIALYSSVAAAFIALVVAAAYTDNLDELITWAITK